MRHLNLSRHVENQKYVGKNLLINLYLSSVNLSQLTISKGFSLFLFDYELNSSLSMGCCVISFQKKNFTSIYSKYPSFWDFLFDYVFQFPKISPYIIISLNDINSIKSYSIKIIPHRISSISPKLWMRKSSIDPNIGFK